MICRYGSHSLSGPGDTVAPDPRGLEPLTFGSGGRRSDSVSSNNEADLRQSPEAVVPSVVPTSPRDPAISDDDLARIVAAWPRLPDAIKTGILAMVKATEPSDA